ncbi:tripartite tricarboxylate transporter TctB family protein [Pseudonocardia adelaidensis]|uniref:Tripartite tricarboxylate transporter TctB family protein n=1 Tax=Pseudonocardia adelaidensis TaxID=648754 RepID=A0ABP9NER5_9PSEU
MTREPTGEPDAAPGLSEALHEIEEAGHEARPPVAGRTTDVVVGVAVVGLGVAALLGSFALGVGSARTPGPGTWPLLISGALVVLGLGLLAMTGRTRDAERFTRASLLVLAGLATMAGFVAVVAVIGFEIPSALLMFVWLRFLGGEPWRTSIVTSIATVVGFYVVFVGLLTVPIPHMF